MSSAPSLKYSKRIAALGAASAAVLSLSTASGAVTTVDLDKPMSYSNSWFAFVPNGSSYVSEYTTSAAFPGLIGYCGLYLLNNQASNFQWTSTLLSEGNVVNAMLSYQNTRSYFFPDEGETWYAGYRYLTSYSGEDPNYTYGYVSVTGGPLPEGGGYNDYTINFYSYESTENAGIAVVAAVPEPSAALLAFAGAGLFFRRRRAR